MWQSGIPSKKIVGRQTGRMESSQLSVHNFRNLISSVKLQPLDLGSTSSINLHGLNNAIARRLKLAVLTITFYINTIVNIYLFIDWFISESVLVIPEGLNGVCRQLGLGKK